MARMADSTASAFPLSVLKPLAGQALERALNQLLALDEQTRTALAALTGRTLTLALESPPLAVQIRVDGERLRVGPVDSAEPDLAIRSTLGGVLAGLRGALAARAGTDAPAPAIGQVRLAGDVQLARELQRLMERFTPDWQRPFVSVFGEALGVRIASTIATALRGVQDGGRALAENTADWLTGQSQLLVPRAELDAFRDDVTVLDMAAARLAARVNALAGRRVA